MPGRPEERARQRIDARLADAGWAVQDRDELDLTAGRGVAVRYFSMKPGFGEADYLLYLDRKAIGAVEAKAGGTLTGVETQTAKYGEGLPEKLPAHRRPLPFLLEVVQAVDEQLSLLAHVESELAERLRTAAGLRQAILREAFAGRLVPQEPDDEPADELLRRIAAQRAARPQGGRRADRASRTGSKRGRSQRKQRPWRAPTVDLGWKGGTHTEIKEEAQKTASEEDLEQAAKRRAPRR